MKKINIDRKSRRKRRVSLRIIGTKERPRISIFRSNQHIFAQAIDDITRTTIASSSSKTLKIEGKEKVNKSEKAKNLGVDMAAKLLKKKINQAIFDRGVYSYLGRVRSVAEGLRQGGVKV